MQTLRLLRRTLRAEPACAQRAATTMISTL